MKLIGIVKDNDLGLFRWTMAAQAFGAYRHRHIYVKGSQPAEKQDNGSGTGGHWPRWKVVIHDDVEVKKMERESYYGGRTECYFVGRVAGRVHQLDISGLYPSEMQRGAFPQKLCYREIPASGLGWGGPTDPDRAIGVVEIDTRERDYPAHGPRGVVWMTGRFVTALAGAELLAAHRLGHISRWYAYAVYKVGPIFKDFIDFCWSARVRAKLRGDTIESKWWKQLPTRLYGKWAQRVPRWESAPHIIPTDPWCVFPWLDVETNKYRTVRALSWDAEIESEGTDAAASFTAISAWISSAANERMRSLRIVAGEREVYYQAVDSLYVSDTGLSRLEAAGEIHPMDLGKLRVEGTADNAEFRGYQDYTFGNVITRGPIQPEAVPVGGDRWSQAEWESLENCCRRPPDGTIEVKDRWLRWHGCPPRGVVGPDGWVSPIVSTEGHSPFPVDTPPNSSATTPVVVAADSYSLTVP